MAEHKAPTAVTVARTEESGAFTRWVERNWKGGLVLAVIGAVVVLVMAYRSKAQTQARDASWDKLMAVASRADTTGFLTGPADELTQLSDELSGTQAAPWSLYIAATSALAEERFDEAEQALARLRERFADHPLVTDTYAFEEGKPKETLLEHLQHRIDENRSFKAEHASLYGNPELPEGSPRVRLNTSEGAVVLGLYREQAPKHVDNFLQLCADGFYDNTKFHRVIKDFMIQGGDPNTKEDNQEEWGQGDPGYTIEREENELSHFEGYLSAAKKPKDVESSGSQFFITTAGAHHLDGQHVVFGKLLEGQDIVDQIEAGVLQVGTDRPQNPVSIVSVNVL